MPTCCPTIAASSRMRQTTRMPFALREVSRSGLILGAGCWGTIGVVV